MRQKDIEALEGMAWLTAIIYSDYSWQELALSGRTARASEAYRKLNGGSLVVAYDIVSRYKEEMEVWVLSEREVRSDKGATE